MKRYPLGARARPGKYPDLIDGTNQPSTIGSFVASGCIRLTMRMSRTFSGESPSAPRSCVRGSEQGNVGIAVRPRQDQCNCLKEPLHHARCAIMTTEGRNGSNFSEVILPICLSDTKCDGNRMSTWAAPNYQCKCAPLSELRWWLHGIWAPLTARSLGTETSIEGPSEIPIPRQMKTYARFRLPCQGRRPRYSVVAASTTAPPQEGTT